MSDERLFDLNIECILEAWDNSHAVRELIANALDEQVLTGSRDIEIVKDGDAWTIRDWGRGLRYEHFTQNENPEKLKAVGTVIGKFGVGLKDAMATLHRSGVEVEIESAHGVITLSQRAKHGFGDVVTLHAAVARPKDREFTGTIVRLHGLPDQDMESAKNFFLKFSGEKVVEQTRVGQILEKRGPTSRIYVAGLLVAEEENFAFSYNITSLTEAMKRALNRERTNVGRTAYTERVKTMLLQTNSPQVAEMLADQLVLLERGTASDEVRWKDVAVHACKILNGCVIPAVRRTIHPAAIAIVVAAHVRRADTGGVPTIALVVIAVGVAAFPVRRGELIAGECAGSGADDRAEGFVALPCNEIADDAADTRSCDGGDDLRRALLLASRLRLGAGTGDGGNKGNGGDARR